MRRRVEGNALEPQRARRRRVPGDSGHQQHAAGQMHGRIAQARAVGGNGAGAPDHGRRPDRQQFPEDEHRRQVAGERNADGRTRVDHRGGHLEPALLAVREEAAAERHDCEDQREQARKPVDGERRQVVAEKARPPQHPFGQRERDADRHCRGDENDGAARAAAQRRGKNAGGDQQQARVQKLNHRGVRSRSRCRAASGRSRAPWPPRSAPHTRRSRTRRRRRTSTRARRDGRGSRRSPAITVSASTAMKARHKQADGRGTDEPVRFHGQLRTSWRASARGTSAKKNISTVNAAVITSAATIGNGASPCAPVPARKNAR